MRFRSVAAAFILAASLTACDDTVNPCGVNPTSAGIFGQCVEADGELCDDDPCDADDFMDVDSHKTRKPTPKVTRPAVKASTRIRR